MLVYVCACGGGKAAFFIRLGRIGGDGCRVAVICCRNFVIKVASAVCVFQGFFCEGELHLNARSNVVVVECVIEAVVTSGNSNYLKLEFYGLWGASCGKVLNVLLFVYIILVTKGLKGDV